MDTLGEDLMLLAIQPDQGTIAARQRLPYGLRGSELVRLAASWQRDNHPVRPDGHVEPEWQGPDACRAFVREQAAMGFDAVKFLLSNDDVFIPGGSQITQYTQEEASAAGEQARESGVWLNCHAQSAESVKVAVRAGFRSVYHCTYADSEALDLLESVKDEVFVSPAPGIIYADIHEGGEFGIDRAQAEKMGSVAALEGMAAVYPEIRKRGIRALPGGDYGFPNNPIGRNARDLELFVNVLRVPAAGGSIYRRRGMQVPAGQPVGELRYDPKAAIHGVPFAVGTPDQVIEKLRAYQDLPMDEMAMPVPPPGHGSRGGRREHAPIRRRADARDPDLGHGGVTRGLHHIGYWTADLDAAMARPPACSGSARSASCTTRPGRLPVPRRAATLDPARRSRRGGRCCWNCDQVHEVRPDRAARGARHAARHGQPRGLDHRRSGYGAGAHGRGGLRVADHLRRRCGRGLVQCTLVWSSSGNPPAGATSARLLEISQGRTALTHRNTFLMLITPVAGSVNGTTAAAMAASTASRPASWAARVPPAELSSPRQAPARLS